MKTEKAPKLFIEELENRQVPAPAAPAFKHADPNAAFFPKITTLAIGEEDGIIF